MRLIATLLFLSCFAVALPSAVLANGNSEVKFVRVWPQWRAADSFLRISEYLGGEENTGRQTVLRSQPDNRDGFYFLVRVKADATSAGEATFVLEVITPDSARPKAYEFPATLSKGSRVFNLGLTGTDWASEETHPVAWKLSLISSDDSEIASQQSFLWSMPESQ